MIYDKLEKTNFLAEDDEVKSKASSKSIFNKWFSVIWFILPRVSATYPLYILPSLFAVKPQRKQVFQFVILVSVCFISVIISSFFNRISITAFLLSIFLQLPFLMFILGFKINKYVDAKVILRAVNVFTFFFSLLNMVQYGFPFKLPYINFLPDRFSSFYGQGGAKIVTVIGFFGFAAEIFAKKEFRNYKTLIISLLNFIVPNYLTGMIMGLGALAIVSLKNGYMILLIVLILIIGTPYAIDRFQNLNNGFANTTGYNPKIFAYISVLELYAKYPVTIFTGTGLGQFSSTPALWASTYISALSTHDIPNIPGLNMSGYHKEILGPILAKVGDISWALSSSANKPYSSITTMLSEYGFVLTLVLGFLFFQAFRKMGLSKRYVFATFLFVFFLFTTDLWNDNLWLGYLLILSQAISTEAK